MLPGNSFPQICVVSVNSIVENGIMAQEYLRVVAFSNHLKLLNSKLTFRAYSARCVRRAFDGGKWKRVRAAMESLIRLSTPVLRISRPTWACTVRSSMPISEAISRLERASKNQLEHLALAVGEFGSGDGGMGARFLKEPVNEFGEQTARRPDGAFGDRFDGLAQHGRARTGFKIGPCSGDDGVRAPVRRSLPGRSRSSGREDGSGEWTPES